MKSAILMAAGKGTRMHSKKPKVLHEVCFKPMIEHILDRLDKINVDQVVTIVGYGHELIEESIKNRCMFALQEPQLGTGHAVMQASQLKGVKGLTLVANGDCPRIQSETYQRMFDECENAQMTILTAILEDAKQYGRIVRDEKGYISKIVEFKDCSEEEKKIKEINTGIYCFDNQVLFDNLSEIKNNNSQNEYYITDMVEILNQKGFKVKAVIIDDPKEAEGVNDKVELADASRWIQEKINTNWMKRGVTLVDPKSTYIGADVKLGEDVTIYPNCTLTGNTIVDDETIILSNCWLQNASVGKNCLIDSSRITDSRVDDDVTIGPFAHLRMNCHVESKNRIGNFVEFKNTHLGYDSRCAHLTYLGDSEIGSKVNMGCGVVTVNYDGKNKFKTTVQDGAFIGSNVNLIAPINIGKNAVVAAGSTVNKDVEDGSMAIARTRQENKAGYGIKYKEKEKK